MSKNMKKKNTKKYIQLLDDLIEDDEEDSKIYTNNKPVSYVKFKQTNDFHEVNENGLGFAYMNKDNYLHSNDDTLFIAGTQTSQDWFDNLKNIPFGDITKNKRYKDADDHLKNNPNINRLVGHSAGGNIALALQKNNPDKNFKVVTYGSPIVSLDPFKENKNDIESFKHNGDPIASLDMYANKVPIQSNNPFTLHSYKGYNNPPPDVGFTLTQPKSSYVYDSSNHDIKPYMPPPSVGFTLSQGQNPITTQQRNEL